MKKNRFDDEVIASVLSKFIGELNFGYKTIIKSAAYVKEEEQNQDAAFCGVSLQLGHVV